MIRILPAAGSVSRGPDFGADVPVIGIVNNMPDAALLATEHQFSDLLTEASQNFLICLRFFSMPQLPRSEAGRACVKRYEAIGELLAADRLDGLIVTGTEVHAPLLQDEPYWTTLTKVVDWADDHTTSTIWSCLAAHAAVLHLDGIQRRPFREKLSGVFECNKVGDHAIVADAPARWCVPHSRYNSLLEEELVSRGYRVLSRSPEVGADLFVREGRSLFVFLQGHPEYDSPALFREYRRDIREFVAGERDNYPAIPRGYFDDKTVAEFDELRDRTLRDRSAGSVLKFPDCETTLPRSWHEQAVRLYTNWLCYLVEHKHSGDRLKESHPANASHAG
jgi:homoserine O-succinyltransferase/O-acetyltransferase